MMFNNLSPRKWRHPTLLTRIQKLIISRIALNMLTLRRRLNQRIRTSLNICADSRDHLSNRCPSL